jgi:two-component system chemotaxis response regulator CheY
MRIWRILIVDDSPAMRAFIRRVVERSEFGTCEFAEAENGLQALEITRAGRPDVVLTDINMPVMNGEEFLRRLSTVPSPDRPPVIVVSTDSTHSRMDRMSALGAAAYLRKPFTPEQMRDVLVTAISESEVLE